MDGIISLSIHNTSRLLLCRFCYLVCVFSSGFRRRRRRRRRLFRHLGRRPLRRKRLLEFHLPGGGHVRGKRGGREGGRRVCDSKLGRHPGQLQHIEERGVSRGFRVRVSLLRFAQGGFGAGV